MSTSVTLRVLVSKKELDDLKAIAAYHEKNCKTNHKTEVDSSDAAVKSGFGSVDIGPDGDHTIQEIPSFSNAPAEANSDQRNGPVSEKDILISGATSVSIPERKEPFHNSKELPLSNEVIISSIRIRFQKRAMKLLNEIAKHPSLIHYDDKGIVTINGTFFESSNIKDLLASCFYTTHSKEVNGLSMWIEFLKENNLFSNVLNTDLTEENLDAKWFFIGNLT